MIRIGVDLGGTKTAIIALNHAGEVLYKNQMPTPRDYQATLLNIQNMVMQVEQQLSEKGLVGVGIPGTVSPQTGLVKNANSTWINGQPLAQDLSSLLAREVRVANDANCFAVSEATDGSGQGHRVVLGVIIGTGCGAGIAIDGKAHAGGNGLGGEWGHNPLPWMNMNEFQSTDCFCGQQDCIETFISGTGFVRDYNLYADVKVLQAQTIMTRVHQGDADATAAFIRYQNRLTRALAHVVNLLDPDIIVLGGGMSNVDSLYPTVEQLLPDYVLGHESRTQVVKHRHGSDSGVRGAAWLWGK